MGERPQYLESERLDDLARMVAELASEVWILKDRTMVLEHLLTESGVLTPDQLDALFPGQELLARLGEERAAFVARVFGAVVDADLRTAPYLPAKQGG